jgi:uroporphyrinogen decarboxylase
MTSRQRLLTAMRGEVPDCVPVCPDISNMVPAKLTGKPFWDIYIYKNPPLWKAYVDAVKYFDLDGGFDLYDFGDLFGDMGPAWVRRIVRRNPDGSFITQEFCEATGEWARTVEMHTADNPPATNVLPEKLGLPAVPSTWEEIRGVKAWPTGLALWKMIRDEMGEHGIIAMMSGPSVCVLENPEDVYAYYENPKPYYDKRDRMIQRIEKRLQIIRQLDVKPDFLSCSSSGTLIWHTPAIFRELGLPILKRFTELAAAMGIPTHMHSCGPEKELVKMAVEETQLTVIDPLEVPPMGDCDLRDLKRRYGTRIVFRGNLHTTNVMLKGTVGDVVAACRKAIDDAAAGGGFILGSGDQCGRDTPFENLRAVVETARTYGRY